MLDSQWLIPTAVEVPSWAYLDIGLTQNTFDPVGAEAVARFSQVSSTPLVIQPVTSTSAGNQPVPTKSLLPTSSSASHAGAIAGGVVGGVALLAVVCLGAFWFFLRSKGGWNNRQKTQKKINLNEDDAQPSTLVDASTNHIVTRSMPSVPTAPTFNRNAIEPHGFPDAFSPATSTIYTTFGGRNSVDSIPYAGSQTTRGYSYAAEI
ncbi:hypothetical protein FPV67DRAFT_14235 [Lyophyllum atratum]|nr:hypothetical protein FPV67DRAFT_14235 [Lyophyllum atratum]